MNIKEKYKELVARTLTLEDFSEIIDLKNQCKVEMNQEYLYFCDILLIDIYINENMLDDALNATLKSLNNIDNVVFQKIYISLLDRIIYVFIHKRNYKSAYRYAFMKRNALDPENNDEVNRWYLEMAYIYAELNQKDKALLQLKAILNNYPDDSIRSLTLSNLTKLYIDQRQINDAKETLNECLSLVYKLEDEEGIVYCDYLNTKLYILEKNYKLARRGFQDIFKNIHIIGENYLGIANEYISLLIEMDLYDEAFRISQKYIKEIDKSSNLYVKKDFYKNYLKIYILKNKNVRDDLRSLLQAIDVLEEKIERLDVDLLNETNEDDKNIEISNKIKTVLTTVEKTLNTINLALIGDNLRAILMGFFQSLGAIVSFDEALYIMFAPGSEVVPELYLNRDHVLVCQYKNKRLYERDYSYNNLDGTIVEMIIAANHEIVIDFNETPLPVKDILSDVSYAKQNVKTLVALPMKSGKDLVGCAVFLSYGKALTEHDAIANIKLAGSLLEKAITEYHDKENIRVYGSILGFHQQNLEAGCYYAAPDKERMMLSDNLAAYLGCEGRVIKGSEYKQLVLPEDIPIYENAARFMEEGDSYYLEYRLRLRGEHHVISESGCPYITKDSIIKFYTVIITPVSVEHLSQPYTLTRFTEIIENLLHRPHDDTYQSSFVRIKIQNLHEYERLLKDKIIIYVFDILSQISDKVYFLEDDSFMIVLEGDARLTLEQSIKSTLNLFENGFVIDERVITLFARAGVVRYPKDTYNAQEILKLTALCLKGRDVVQILNDEIKKQYLKEKAVNVCIAEQLKRGNIELLYTELAGNFTGTCYEVGYNISGLRPEEIIWPYLEHELLIMFEELSVSTLINDIVKTKDTVFYFHITSETLNYLYRNDYFKRNLNDIKNRIIFCLDNYMPACMKIIEDLHNSAFRFSLNHSVFNDITLGSIANSNVYGFFSYRDEDVDPPVAALIGCLQKEYLTNAADGPGGRYRVTRKKGYKTIGNLI